MPIVSGFLEFDDRKEFQISKQLLSGNLNDVLVILVGLVAINSGKWFVKVGDFTVKDKR